MSPEQVSSQNVDHRTDLFSLGITLYEMLTGRKPFTGDSVITITYNIMNLQPTMPIGVPPMLQGILQKSLAKDPNLRYQNAAAFAADLRAQKFELESPAYQKTGSITFGPLNAPAAAAPPVGQQSFYPGQPAPPIGSYPSTTGDYLSYGTRASGLSAQARSFLGLIAAIVGVILLLLLLIWGVSAALRSYQSDSKQRAAYQMESSAQKALSAGNLSTAANDFQSAQQVAPPGSQSAQDALQGLSNVEIARGQQYQKSNDSTDAQSAYQQALALDSHNANAYNTLGQLHYQQGDLPGAAQYWEQAAQADPSSPIAEEARNNATQTYQTLAQQAQGQGNLSEARDYWQKIMETDPGTPAAQNALDQINATAPGTQPPPGP
jgi:serine/threonine protein kinase